MFPRNIIKNLQVRSDLLAVAGLHAGVQGEQHLRLHLAGGSRLLLCQRRYPRQDDPAVQGGVLGDRGTVQPSETGLNRQPAFIYLLFSISLTFTNPNPSH